MILGIVGAEGKKFTAESEELARMAIRGAIKSLKATAVCSGACHLGGIDIWAVEEATALQRSTIEYPPTVHKWAVKGGFMERNIMIAKTSDVVICFVPVSLPPDYKPGGWEFYCYHCGTDAHIKSGGCWTTKYARSLGKPGYTLVVK